MPATPDVAEALRANGGNIAATARALGRDRRRVSEDVNGDRDLRALLDELRRPGPTGRARLVENGNTATAESAPTPEGALPTPASLMVDLGLDPDEWEVEKSVASKWGSREDPQFQLKLWLRRVVVFEWPVLPAAHVPAVTRPSRRKSGARPALVAIFSDPHCPYHDPALDSCVEQFLDDVRPDRGVIAGDVLDLPTLSTHKRNPAYNATPQECVDAAYPWTRRKVEASPSTEWEWLLGNHDARLRDYNLREARETYGLRPARLDGDGPTPPETAAESTARLLNLDALGICVVGSPNDGEYQKAEVKLARKLGVRHGWESKANAGKSYVERLGYSLVYGHDHRIGTSYVTRYDEDGPKQLVAIGTGTLALIEDGLGYAEKPNWQQGFVTVALWPDGTFNVEHAVYTAGALRWRDRLWTP